VVQHSCGLCGEGEGSKAVAPRKLLWSGAHPNGDTTVRRQRRFEAAMFFDGGGLQWMAVMAETSSSSKERRRRWGTRESRPGWLETEAHRKGGVGGGGGSKSDFFDGDLRHWCRQTVKGGGGGGVFGRR
jgi:hypothetical protein